MAHAPDIAGNIPFLRRYARALTGDQALGDQYVRIALEMIRENPERLPSQGDPRREIFRLFHEVWAKAASAHGAPGEGRAWEFVGRAARRERQLLLLVALEGCSLAEASYILDIGEAEARDLFRVAQAALARHAPAPILIIEDEMLIAMDLEAIIEGAGHKVCGIATGESEALAMASQTTPRLILADIHLKGGESGIVAVRKILRSLSVPVIFITGYPQDLLTGMAPEPAFVITKPFQSETVIAAVSQALLTEFPAEPDAVWRLRGRPPEETDITRLQPGPSNAAGTPPRPVGYAAGKPRHSVNSSSPSEDSSCGSALGTAAQGNGHARRADETRP